MNKDIFQVIGWSSLIVAGLVLSAIFWKVLLAALVIIFILGTALAILAGVPTFFISLWMTRSPAKASERTGEVVIYCYVMVIEFGLNMASGM